MTSTTPGIPLRTCKNFIPICNRRYFSSLPMRTRTSRTCRLRSPNVIRAARSPSARMITDTPTGQIALCCRIASRSRRLIRLRWCAAPDRRDTTKAKRAGVPPASCGPCAHATRKAGQRPRPSGGWMISRMAVLLWRRQRRGKERPCPCLPGSTEAGAAGGTATCWLFGR